MFNPAATLASAAPAPPSLAWAVAGLLTCSIFVAVVYWAFNENQRRRGEPDGAGRAGAHLDDGPPDPRPGPDSP
jgi:cbb3-type cytochrome oxidase subunit 3